MRSWRALISHIAESSHILIRTSAQYPHAQPVTTISGNMFQRSKTVAEEQFPESSCSDAGTEHFATMTSQPVLIVLLPEELPIIHIFLFCYTFWLSPLVSSFPPELSNSVFKGAAHNSNSVDQQPSLLLFSAHSQDSRCPYGGSVTMPGYSRLLDLTGRLHGTIVGPTGRSDPGYVRLSVRPVGQTGRTD